MCYKRFIPCLILALLSLWAGMSLTSCSREKVDLEDVNVVDLQIHRFVLSSKKEPALSSVFFSIDHKNGTIINKKALPYGTVLDSVMMHISTATSAKKLQVAINDGEYHDWQTTDSLWLRDCHTLHLTVTDESGEMTKNYTVTLNHYDYEPTTFVWNLMSGVALPDLNATYADVVTHGDKAYLVAVVGGSTVLYATDKNNPMLWSLLPTSGLTGACRQIAVAEDGRAWILTETGKLYQSDNFAQWTEVAPGGNVSALLGGMVWPQGSHTLALLGEKDGKLCFATNIDGVFTWREEAPKSFPVRNFSAQLYRSNNHPMLRVVGGVSRAGEAVDSVWISSNGNDWIALKLDSAAIPASVEKGALVATSSDGNLYYYATEYREGVKRLAVSYSTDKGVSWHRGEADVMLPANPLYAGGYPHSFVCAFGSSTYNIYQFGGVSSSGTFFSELWKGVLKLNENNSN